MRSLASKVDSEAASEKSRFLRPVLNVADATLIVVRHRLSPWYSHIHLLQKSNWHDILVQWALFSMGLTLDGWVHLGQGRSCSSGFKREASSAKSLCLNLLGLVNIEGGSKSWLLLVELTWCLLSVVNCEVVLLSEGENTRDSSASRLDTLPRALRGLVLSSLTFRWGRPLFVALHPPSAFSDHMALASLSLELVLTLPFIWLFHRVDTCRALPRSLTGKYDHILSKMWLMFLSDSRRTKSRWSLFMKSPGLSTVKRWFDVSCSL